MLSYLCVGFTLGKPDAASTAARNRMISIAYTLHLYQCLYLFLFRLGSFIAAVLCSTRLTPPSRRHSGGNDFIYIYIYTNIHMYIPIYKLLQNFYIYIPIFLYLYSCMISIYIYMHIFFIYIFCAIGCRHGVLLL